MKFVFYGFIFSHVNLSNFVFNIFALTFALILTLPPYTFLCYLVLCVSLCFNLCLVQLAN